MIEEKLPDIARDLINKTISVAAQQETGDSMIKRIIQRTVTAADIDNSNLSFYHNYGTMNDGSRQRIHETELHLSLYANIQLLNEGEVGHMDKASTRSGNNLPSLLIYVNGIKIPDSLIYLYCGISGTDIIIPESFFDINGDNEVIIEHRKFINYTYGGIYQPFFSGTSIVVPVSAHRNLNITKASCLTFLNGFYIYDKIQSITINSNNFIIEFNQALSGDLEVFIDSSSVAHFVNNQTETAIASFYISDSFLDPLYGPKSKDACIFMVNGKRVGNKNVEMVGRLNYEYTLDSTLDNVRSEIIYTDLGLIKDTGMKIYADDYYLYNMIGSIGVTNGLYNGISGNTTFDGNIVFDEVLNKEGDRFDYVKTNTLISNLNNLFTPENKILHLLNTRPYLVREFLKHFGEKKRYFNIEYNGTDETVYLGSAKEYTPGTKITRIVFVNGYYAQSDMIEVNDYDHYWAFSAPGTFFETGDNMVEVVEYSQPVTSKSFDVISTTPVIEDSVTYYRYETELFGNIQTIDDLVLLEVVYKEDDPDGVYVLGSTNGFKVVDPINYSISILSGVILIDFGESDISKETIISSKRIFGQSSVTVTEANLSYESMLREIYIGTITVMNPHTGEPEEAKVPVVHEGTFLAFSNDTGERIFENTDFLYRSPITHTIMKNSGMMFKRNFEVGTRIDFFMIPIKQRVIQYTEDTFSNPYGLLYIGGLDYPYSPEYVSITVNNRRLHPDEIDILSDKLIRIHSEDVSFQDLYIETTLDIELSDLSVFTSTYNMSDFELFIASIFSGYDYSRTEGTADVDVANDAYETFVTGVDSNAKTPNPIRSENFIDIRYQPYINAYILWFISDQSDSVWKGYIDTPEEVLNQIEIYYDGIEPTNRDIILHSYDRVLFSEVHYTMEGYTGLNDMDTKRIFLEKSDEYGLDPQDFFEEYDNHPLSNVLYKEDLRAIQGTDLLNSEEGDDIIIGRSIETFPII